MTAWMAVTSTAMTESGMSTQYGLTQRPWVADLGRRAGAQLLEFSPSGTSAVSDRGYRARHFALRAKPAPLTEHGQPPI